MFKMSEVFDLEKELQDFVQNWKSHGDPVKGYANLFFGRFLIIMADETDITVSGCSTDSAVRFVKSLEEKFKTDFFNRTQLAFYRKDKVEIIPQSQLPYAIQHGFVTPEIMYFDNTVITKKALLENWITPASKSWLKRYFNTVTPSLN